MINKSKNNQSGFTLTELVVSAMIFSLSVAGLLATVSSLNRPSADSFEDVQAAYLGQEVLEDLKKEIDASVWDETTSNLAIGEHEFGPFTRQGISYNVIYTVNADASGGRWVDLTVQWND